MRTYDVVNDVNWGPLIKYDYYETIVLRITQYGILRL